MLATAVVLCAGLCSGSLATNADVDVEARTEYLSALRHRFLHVQHGWGELGIDTCTHARSQEPLPLKIGDREYRRGLGHHAAGEIIVDLNGEYERFEADVGLQALPDNSGSVEFKVYVDDEPRFESGIMRRATPAKSVSVPLTGAQELRLVLTDAGDGITSDCANWADARLIRAATPMPPKEGLLLDAAPFAQVITCDPTRMDGSRANRIQAYRAEDVYLETASPSRPDGGYVVPGYNVGLGCIGLKWNEHRYLRRLAIEFVDDTAPASLEGLQVQCWVGESAWQGGWKPLAAKTESSANRVDFLLDWASCAEAQGSTRKVRFIFPAAPRPIVVRRFSATVATLMTDAKLELRLVSPGQGVAEVEASNGQIVVSDGSKPSIMCRWDLANPLALTVRYTRPRPWKSDRTLLRFSLPSGLVVVAVSDVLDRGCVYVPHAGLLVLDRSKGIDAAACLKEIAGRETVLEEVRRRPDQTFARALAAVHRQPQDSGPVLLSLPCDNHKVIVHRDGVIQFSDSPEADDKAMHSALSVAGRLTPRFGSGKNEGMTRRLDGDWLPAPVTTVREGDVVYRQRTFVAPLRPGGADVDEPVCVAEFTVENTGTAEADASLALSILAKADPPDTAEIETLASDGGVIAYRNGRLLAFITTAEAGSLKARPGVGSLTLSGRLLSKAVSHCTVRIPLWRIGRDQHAMLASPTDLFAAMRDLWDAALAPAMKVEVPDPLLMNVIKASQVHCLLAARSEAGGSRVAPWIASMHYGPLESESHSIVRGMDFMGHHDFARRGLDFFIHRYSPEGFLTTGYTLMGTGWHLWTLGEHYQLTRDKVWMEKVAPDVARVCRWIVEQRKKTQHPGPDGEKAPEYGLLPPGVMADWNAFAYYFCLNGYYCAGLEGAARALADVGHPEASAFAADAAEFRQEILRAFHWTQERMPVFPLRDGTFVPGYPSQVHTPGPTHFFFPGQDGNRSWCYDVELGSHHLVPFGIVDALSRDVDWMMDHMEDVQFLSDGWFDYPAEASHKDPYNLGGFAKVQPYYCRNAEVYAMRDEVKPFIRTYFNTIPSLLNTEVLSFWEHFHGVGAWNKTHETGYFLHQTRLMLVMERGDDLWLAPFVTNQWLNDGQTVAVTGASTRFGPVSFRITSAARQGHIEATIEPPGEAAGRHPPREIVIRLRHPDAKPIRSVTVDGRPHADFDAAKECVRLPAGQKKLVVRANF